MANAKIIGILTIGRGRRVSIPSDTARAMHISEGDHIAIIDDGTGRYRLRIIRADDDAPNSRK